MRGVGPAGRRRAQALVLGVVAVAGCRPDCRPSAGAVRPNVVLVTIDTLRADHLGAYGSRTVRTPHLDRLASEGALFERAYSQTHVTVPSHLTLLSSLPLASHGMNRNEMRVPRPVPVLPDAFRTAGYRTAAFVSAQHLGPDGPLAPLLRELEAFDGPHRQSITWTAEETNHEVFRWLRGVCPDPFFLWVHYFDPHMPYAPPAPYDTAYYDGDPYDPGTTSLAGVPFTWYHYETADMRPSLAAHAGKVRAVKHELGVRTRDVRRLVLYPHELSGHVNGDRAAHARVRGRLRDLGAALRPLLPLRKNYADWLTGVRDARFPRARYAGEVTYTDAQVGRLREELERLGLAGRTILVVTADHGESLGEHGVYFAHIGLREPALRVPLIVWAPGRVAAARHAGLARGLDVAPTILRLAGLPAPASMQGRDLLGAGDDGPVVAESIRGLQIMAVADRWKLIRTRQSFHYVDAFEREAGAVELYDLEADPGEADDVATRHPEVLARLGGALDTWLATHPADGSAPAGGALAPEVERGLRALGYVE